MPEPDFQFARAPAVGGEVLWHVRQAGRFLGTIAEIGGGFQATKLTAAGMRTRRFGSRNAAARWLAKITATA